MSEVIVPQPNAPLSGPAEYTPEAVSLPIRDGPIPGTECGGYGERLAVSVVDELAAKTPERVWATITRSANNIDDGFRDINFRQLAGAMNLVAWSTHEQFGTSDNFEVLAYLGLSDVRYAIYMFAAIKTGHQLMIPSVRNSLSQHLAVFDEAKCGKVFYTPEMESRIKELKEARPGLVTVLVPTLDELLSTPTKHYPYNKTWAEARTDPILVAHSSGSTGNPKPTTITNGVYSVYDNHRKVPAVPGRRIQSYTLLEFEGGGRFFNPFPPFHLAGLFAMTIMPIFYTCTVTMGPPEKPPSGELLSKAMRKLKIRAAWCPPTVIEQLVDLPGGFEQASSLDWIMYTGGPLAPAVGDRLSRVTDVCQLYGSTETGPHIAMVPLPDNWNYFEWHPLLENKMEPMGDGTFEMVVYKDSSLDWIRHLSQAYPHLDVWRTNDLFVQAPNNPRLWRFTGRRDDVLVLSNGEKFNPVNMEGTITGHPLVKGALIVGTARFQASLIVEPTDDMDMSDEQFINHIWPTVEEANGVGPAHGRIFRSKVVVASKGKPFQRAGKGTVIRGRTTKLYAEEVDQLYKEDEDDDIATSLSDAASLEAITSLVTSQVKQLLSYTSFSGDDDLFVLGMDSLQTSELSKMLQRALRSVDKAGARIATTDIYANPTIARLSQHIYATLNEDSQGTSNDAATKNVGMSDLVEKYTFNLPLLQATQPDKKVCVALTGSTGSLGSHILETLINDDRVSKIYCLNRSGEAFSRHQQSFKARGKRYSMDNVVFLQVKFGELKFGLSSSAYNDLTENADAIIHNAWMVNFNHKLSSFESVHIRGVRDLVDFSLASPRQPHIFFVSSLSSVGNWPQVRGYGSPVPEDVPSDYALAMPLGYAESKHVSERIISAAVEKCGLNASILRVGQVGGPVAEDGGEWNKTEWLPSLVKTSKALGCLPDSMNTVDWIPVDTLARIIRDIVHSDQSQSKSQVFNLVNPHAGDWTELVSAIRDEWATENPRVVPFPEWLKALREVEKPDMSAMPAFKILDFYEGLAKDVESCKTNRLTYETTNGRRCSETMATLSPINAAAMKTWLRQWNF